MSESAVCGKVGTRADVGTGANSCDYGLWHPHLSLPLFSLLFLLPLLPRQMIETHYDATQRFRSSSRNNCVNCADVRRDLYIWLRHEMIQVSCSADHAARSDSHTMQRNNQESWEWRRVLLLLSSIISFVAAISIQNSLPSPSSMGITQSKAL